MKKLVSLVVMSVVLGLMADTSTIYSNGFDDANAVADCDRSKDVSFDDLNSMMSVNGWSGYWEKTVSLVGNGEVTVTFTCVPNWQNTGSQVLQLNGKSVLRAANASVTLGDDASPHAASVGGNNVSITRKVTAVIDPRTGNATIKYDHPIDPNNADHFSTTCNIGTLSGSLFIRFGVVNNGWRVDNLLVEQANENAGITRNEDGSIALDIITRNGGKTGGLLDSPYENILTSAYDASSGIETLTRTEGYDLNATSENGAVKLWFTSAVRSKWSGPGLKTGGLPILLKEINTVKIPYLYNGTKLVGQKMRLIAYVGSKHFTVESDETIVASESEWQTATFDFAPAFAAVPADFTACADSPLSELRFYFYGTQTQVMNSIFCGFWAGIDFEKNVPFLVGNYLFSGVQKFFTATFQSNGGTEVEPITSDADGHVTLPDVSREGYTLRGWNDRQSLYQPGDVVTLQMDTTFYAVWNANSPAAGITRHGRRTVVNYAAALGSTYGMLRDVYRDNATAGSYDAATGKYFLERSGTYKLSLAPDAAEGRPDLLKVTGESGSGGWNGPSVELPSVGLSVNLANKLSFEYYYPSNVMVGNVPTLYFQIGEKWYRVAADAGIVKEAWTTLTFDLRSALGGDYRTLKKQTLGAMRLYLYNVDVFESSFAYSTGYNFNGGTWMQLSPFTFEADPSAVGFSISIL